MVCRIGQVPMQNGSATSAPAPSNAEPGIFVLGDRHVADGGVNGDLSTRVDSSHAASPRHAGARDESESRGHCRYLWELLRALGPRPTAVIAGVCVTGSSFDDLGEMP
jgi:hypothetical protein